MGAQLSPEDCSGLARALILDTADLLRRVRDVRRILCYAPRDGWQMLEQLVGSDFDYVPQSDGDLGDRMLAAFEWSFDRANTKVIIIGADSPGLPAEWIEEAFAGLDEKDVVLGPTLDGGYYLIGLKSLQPALFIEVAWSTDSVFATTLDRVIELGLSLHLLAPLSDLDYPEDLDFFKTHIRALRIAGKPFPVHTAEFVEAL
jgi:rSAM/selenodomain-associated transferase 1